MRKKRTVMIDFVNKQCKVMLQLCLSLANISVLFLTPTVIMQYITVHLKNSNIQKKLSV